MKNPSLFLFIKKICFFILFFMDVSLSYHYGREPEDLFILKKNQTETFPPQLIKENEYLANFPSSPYLFVLSREDFILCKKNPLHQSKPKQSNFTITFFNQTYQDIGTFNNDLITNYIQNRKLKETIQMFEKGYSLDPLFFAFLYNLGRLYAIDKQYNKSNFYFNKVLYYFPDYPRIHYHLGKNYFYIKNIHKGEYHLRKAIQLNPDSVIYLTTWIQFLLDTDQFSKANLYLKYGKKRFPRHNYFRMFEARIFFRNHKYIKALQKLQSLNENLLSSQEKLELYFLKAQLYEKTNQIPKAIEELNKILKEKEPAFFNQYPEKEIQNQKKRLEMIINSQEK